MKTFSFNPKTGKFECKMVAYISFNDMKYLKVLSEYGYFSDTWRGDNEKITKLGMSQYDDGIGFYDIVHHLRNIGFIIHDHEARVCTNYDAKNLDYKNLEYKKVSGYFLTDMGKAFMQSLGIKTIVGIKDL